MHPGSLPLAAATASRIVEWPSHLIRGLLFIVEWPSHLMTGHSVSVWVLVWLLACLVCCVAGIMIIVTITMKALVSLLL